MVAFENRRPVTAAKFINKSSLFVLLPGVVRLLELKPISEQKAENIFVARHIAKPNVGGSYYFTRLLFIIICLILFSKK